MATTRKATRLKEPVKVRTKKLADGSESYYLDIYVDGRRSYEFLKLYLLPEINPMIKEQNRAIKAAVEAIKSKRIIELTHSKAGLKKDIRPFQNAAGRLDGNLSCRTGAQGRKRAETVADGLPYASLYRKKGEDAGNRQGVVSGFYRLDSAYLQNPVGQAAFSQKVQRTTWAISPLPSMPPSVRRSSRKTRS